MQTSTCISKGPLSSPCPRPPAAGRFLQGGLTSWVLPPSSSVSHGNPVPLGSHPKCASFPMLHLHLDTRCFFVITSELLLPPK